VLAISRGFIAEQGVAFEPELALLEVVAHTHWLPRHWRGRGHTREVQEQFQQLFQFKVCHPLLFTDALKLRVSGWAKTMSQCIKMHSLSCYWRDHG